MFNADTVTFQEFMTRESLPLATIHNAMLEFLRGRDDAVVFGAQAVNAYVSEPRMTEDINLLSTRAKDLAEELREYLSRQFHIALRIRRIGEGRGYRLFQVRKTGNRHLADVRPVSTLPPSKRIAKVLVIAPADLIASKVIAYHRRRGQPKSGTDWRDLAMLLMTFPDLKRESGPVSECLRAAGADRNVLRVWRNLVAQEIRSEDKNEKF